MKKALMLALGIFLLGGCGLHEGVVQKAEKSYIKFSGNTSSVLVQIDDMAPFDLAFKGDSTLYQVAPGKHSVKISRGGSIVVNKLVFIDSGAAAEIIIP